MREENIRRFTQSILEDIWKYKKLWEMAQQICWKTGVTILNENFTWMGKRRKAFKRAGYDCDEGAVEAFKIHSAMHLSIQMWWRCCRSF